jgi:hypothetical protein
MWRKKKRISPFQLESERMAKEMQELVDVINQKLNSEKIMEKLDIEKINKLRLRENEVVNTITFKEACAVCELADKLGLKWNNGDSYLKGVRFDDVEKETCYDFNDGVYAERVYFGERGKKIITAIEWLNRHDIFLYGQRALFSDDGQSFENFIMIAQYLSVNSNQEDRFKEGLSFHINYWDTFKSPYPEWIDLAFQKTVKIGHHSYSESKIEELIKNAKNIKPIKTK